MKLLKLTGLAISFSGLAASADAVNQITPSSVLATTSISAKLLQATQSSTQLTLLPSMMEARRGDDAYNRRINSRRYYSRRGMRNNRRESHGGFGSMPSTIDRQGNVIVVDLCRHQLGAYANGQLVRQCPVSGGASYCPDINKSCRSPVGNFRIHNKKQTHYSTRYPVERWKPRAIMPNSLFFNGGYAIHATTSYIRGIHESHGCIRTTYDCSNWLFHNFARIGTPVIVKPYCSSN